MLVFALCLETKSNQPAIQLNYLELVLKLVFFFITCTILNVVEPTNKKKQQNFTFTLLLQQLRNSTERPSKKLRDISKKRKLISWSHFVDCFHSKRCTCGVYSSTSKKKTAIFESIHCFLVQQCCIILFCREKLSLKQLRSSWT